jgi:hypothetical protein
VRASRPHQSRLRLLQAYKGVVENEDSHCYSSSHYDRRLRSLLTNRLGFHRLGFHRCGRGRSELLNVQTALTAYSSNGTRRQQFSHRYALRFRRRHTGLRSRSFPYSYFSTFPPSINQLNLVGIRLYFGTENLLYNRVFRGPLSASWPSTSKGSLECRSSTLRSTIRDATWI